MIPGMGLVGRHSGLAKSGGGRQQNAALQQRGLILFGIASPQGTSQAAAHPVLELLGPNPQTVARLIQFTISSHSAP